MLEKAKELRCWKTQLADLLLQTHPLKRSLTKYLKSNDSKPKMEDGFVLKPHGM